MKNIDNLSKWVIAAALYIVTWSVVFFIAWLVKGEEPSVLEGYILTPGVVELVCSAVIKRGKTNSESGEVYNDDTTDN